jgi:quinolinate synthase
MAKNTLRKLYLCLHDMTPAIEMDEDLRKAALKPLERMLDMSPPAKAPAAKASTLAAQL